MKKVVQKVIDLTERKESPNYNLKKWKSSDKPTMDDFNSDNEKIEDALTSLNEKIKITQRITICLLGTLVGVIITLAFLILKLIL